MEHARNGTLARAILIKLGMARRPVSDPDHYRGDAARDYLAKRLKQEMWHKEQAVVRELLEPMAEGIRVLDVPFGTGRFVEMLHEKKMKIYGIDISEDMLEAAKAELGDAYEACHVEVGSADSLPYEDRSFDLVICFRFLGLLPYSVARDVLSEIRRVCSGDVIVRVPVRKDSAPPVPPIRSSDLVQGRLLEHELVSLFGEFGFSVRETRTVGEREKVVFKVFLLQ